MRFASDHKLYKMPPLQDWDPRRLLTIALLL
jgi:hypothetical protein